MSPHSTIILPANLMEPVSRCRAYHHRIKVVLLGIAYGEIVGMGGARKRFGRTGVRHSWEYQNVREEGRIVAG